jgi:IS66 Orf2 like protein
MRKGFGGLSAQVRDILQLDPLSGAVFLFRGKWARQAKGAGLGWIRTFCVRMAA